MIPLPHQELARRSPFGFFLVIATVFTWAWLPLARTSIAASLTALCGPAVAAVVTASLIGPAERRDLFERVTRWRVSIRWYVVALLAPLPISALVSMAERVAGAPGPIHLMSISPLMAVVFVLVAGEEIGWRGFAQPHLRARHGPWRACVTLGAAWAFWHYPLFFLPSMPQFGSAFVPFVGYTIALSVLLAVLGDRTRHSVVIATLFHGAVNTFGVVNAGASRAMHDWINAGVYLSVALFVGARGLAKAHHEGREAG